MPASRITFAHFTTSRFTIAASSSGLVPAGSAPCAPMRSCISRVFSIASTSALSFATIAAGVRAGAKRPFQVLAS